MKKDKNGFATDGRDLARPFDIKMDSSELSDEAIGVQFWFCVLSSLAYSFCAQETYEFSTSFTCLIFAVYPVIYLYKFFFVNEE